MLRPLKKNAIIKMVEKEKVTESGIILTQVDGEEATRGVVVSVGPDVTGFVVGETILPNWRNARKTKIDDEEFFVINEDDVVLVFEQEE